MTTPVQAFDLIDIPADLRPEWVMDTLRKSGFPENDRTRRMIAEAFPHGERLIRPQAVARLYQADRLASGTLGKLPEPIQRASHFLFAVATSGRSIDEEATRLRRHGKLIKSMLMDAFALTGLYQATARLTSEVHRWAGERNLATSRAFSPGSGRDSWTLSKQALLFDLVPANTIGVELMPSYLMRPTKSISFVLGMGEDIPHITDPFSCAQCPHLDCDYRYEPCEEMISPT